MSIDWGAQVEVILPEAAFVNIEGYLNAKLQKHKYVRVFMPLSSLLEQDFFNTYIKIGIIARSFVAKCRLTFG